MRTVDADGLIQLTAFYLPLPAKKDWRLALGFDCGRKTFVHGDLPVFVCRLHLDVKRTRLLADVRDVATRAFAVHHRLITRPLIELPRLSLNLPSPGFVSLLVSQVNRRYPLEDGNELVSISPRPDQDPARSQIIVC